MDFIANGIQPKIAGAELCSYSVSPLLTNKVDSNEGMWREKRREALIGNISYSHAFSLNT